MPIIRYRTRDITRHRPHHAPDGEDHRPHRRHDHLAQRQPLSRADRGPDPAHPGICRPIFNACWTRTGALDELTVRVERRPDADVSTAYGASSELRALIKNSIGVSVHVDVVEPDQTERSVGKMRRGIDERKHR
jgi:phenylacetate-CoA ligase